MIVDDVTNTVLGEIAHIEGVGKRAARHNPNRPEDTLNDIDNLILLCHDHHTIVDNKKNGYTVAMLRKMKQDHERQGMTEIQQRDATLAKIYIEKSQEVRIAKTTNSNRTYNNSIHAEAYGNARQTVNVFTRAIRDPLPPDAINNNASKRAYVLKLQEKYKEFASAYTSNPKAVAVNLSRAIRKKFGTKAVAVPLSRFDELCAFLQAKINNTNIGKGNRKKGIPNYSSFEE